MSLPDKPEYDCPECGDSDWRWNEYPGPGGGFVGWECDNGCVMSWVEQ